MKKILTLAFALLCMVSVFAANNVDIIIKTNSEKIEALIQEVSDSEIRYKKANNPNGPMFVIKLDDVSSILYSNGEVQAVEHKAQPAQQPQQQSQYNYGTDYSYNNFNALANGPMQRIGADEYMIDGHRLKGKELDFFLRENCPVAYNHHKSWKNCEIAGYCLLAAGTGMFVGLGVVFYSIAYGDRAYLYTGVSFMTIGGALMSASVPMIACGNIFKKRTHMVFNQNCGRQQAFQPELKLTSGANGLGIALAF